MNMNYVTHNASTSRSGGATGRLGSSFGRRRSSGSGCSGSWGSRNWSTTGQRRSVSLKCGDICLVRCNQRNWRSNIRGLALLGDNRSKESIIKGFDVHVRLVGFDDHNSLTSLDSITLTLEPRDNLSFLHGRGESWHIKLAEVHLGRRGCLLIGEAVMVRKGCRMMHMMQAMKFESLRRIANRCNQRNSNASE